MSGSPLSAPLIPVVLASVPLAGYLTIHLTYRTRFYTHRLSGQLQFFSSSIVGAILFAVARLIAMGVISVVPCETGFNFTGSCYE